MEFPLIGGCMPGMPQDNSLDSAPALVRDGYTFISKRCDRARSDVVQTRLLFQPTICMRGKEAAELLYDAKRFQRAGAAPKRMQKTLVGEGGVQGLDGGAHRWRKQMFMSLMTPQSIKRLAEMTGDQWRAAVGKWYAMDTVVLFDEVQEILCRAVCLWAGVPLKELEVKQRTRDLALMIEGAGAVGLKHWQSRQARKRAEHWAGNIVTQIRQGRLEVADGCAAQVIASYHNLDATLLDTRIAAVELLNMLRPTVAIGRYIIFAALALHEHPECQEKLRAEGAHYAEWFVQEVRRFYPFFPFVAARVRKDFEWNGYHFTKGSRALLDLYATNRDPRLWNNPNTFQPERFRTWQGSAFDFIPQGGGDHYTGHRCPGEWITIEVLKLALHALTMSMTYTVPKQDLRMSLSRIPTLPRSRFIISNVRPVYLF